MIDLIDRQATLNALMEAVKSVGVLDADDIKTVFDALPSVQHEKAQLSPEGTTKDTISRQAALEKVRAMQTYKLFMGDDMILVDKAEVQTELMMLPPAQPERMSGEWIEHIGMNHECSSCNHFFPLSYFRGRPFEINYCPNCGAKMGGKPNEWFN